MRFDDGEKTGRKADPAQVAADMKTARDIEGTRKLTAANGWQRPKCKFETKENVS